MCLGYFFKCHFGVEFFSSLRAVYCVEDVLKVAFCILTDVCDFVGKPYA